LNNERAVLAACICDRKAFDAIGDHIQEGDLTEQGKVVLDAIAEYYDRDAKAARVDTEILARDVSRGLPNPKHQRVFTSLIEGLAGMEVSPGNVVHDFICMSRDSVGNKLSVALASGADTTEVRKLIDEYEKWSEAEDLASDEEMVVRGANIRELVGQHFDQSNLIRMLPSSLNERLDGGMRRGHHVLVFARPEVGKTLFVINLMSGFLRDGHTVLYVGNEDPLPDVVLRVITRLTGMTAHEIQADPDKADELARSVGYNNLVLASMCPGTPKEIEALVLEYKPDIVVVDQLRNLHVSEDNRVIQLEKAATAMRNLGKKHNLLVVSVTQAGDSASGKGVLDMGDVDFSNTGIPSQMDLMIGVGMTQQDEAGGRRTVSLSKNKRTGRHDFFPVHIDPQYNRIRSMG
jgi:KaiC/GvpD/RAD55 family RecA-like ATPase